MPGERVQRLRVEKVALGEGEAGQVAAVGGQAVKLKQGTDIALYRK